MQSPVAILDVEGSRDVSRVVRKRVRVAVHIPELDSCVELHVDARGRWSVVTGPDAVHGGHFQERAAGNLADYR